MTDESISMDIQGMDDLVASFQDLIKKYPDEAGALLVRQARELRKDVVKLVKNDTDSDGTNKHSLTKISQYKISKVKGIGAQQYIEVSGKAPHFHLVENGHRLLNKDGKPVGSGFVVGYHFMDRASKKRRIELPTDLEKVVDRLLKEEGLI